jgi:hypothetical protein
MALKLARQKQVQTQFMLFLYIHCKYYVLVTREQRFVLLQLLNERCIADALRGGWGGTGMNRSR